MCSGGRALNGLGGISLTEPYQTPNAIYIKSGSQTTNDKIRGQKGNSPDRQLRSQSVSSVEKDVGFLRQLGCWLRSSHSFKECVIAH